MTNEEILIERRNGRMLSFLKHSFDEENDLDGFAEGRSKMYNVYRIWPRSSAYIGYSLVAAESVEEANKIIQELRDSDKDNDYDSYAYSDISEADLIEDLTSNRIGIIIEGFYYTGN